MRARSLKVWSNQLFCIDMLGCEDGRRRGGECKTRLGLARIGSRRGT